MTSSPPKTQDALLSGRWETWGKTFARLEPVPGAASVEMQPCAYECVSPNPESANGRRKEMGGLNPERVRGDSRYEGSPRSHKSGERFPHQYPSCHAAQRTFLFCLALSLVGNRIAVHQSLAPVFLVLLSESSRKVIGNLPSYGSDVYTPMSAI